MMLVLLACAAPVVLSYLTYYVIRPEGRVHHGELIEPQRMLPAWSAKDLQGKETPLVTLKGQWLLVAVGSGECGEKCERLLFVQRQLHKLLNKLCHIGRQMRLVLGLFRDVALPLQHFTQSAAQIIDPASVDAGGRVVFGATVELEDEDSGDQVKYQIVGEDEADLKLGLINISSPIARALIGKEEGDVAEVQAPGGVRRYEIIAVSYL